MKKAFMLKGIMLIGIHWDIYRILITTWIGKNLLLSCIFSFDTLTLQQDCGIKLFGESTRRYQDKSFKLIARSEYGKNVFKNQFFPFKKNRQTQTFGYQVFWE